MITAKELRDKFDADLKALQEVCKHEDTGEAEECWAPGHFSGSTVKYCKVCEKILERRESIWEPQQFVVSENEPGIQLGGGSSEIGLVYQRRS